MGQPKPGQAVGVTVEELARKAEAAAMAAPETASATAEASQITLLATALQVLRAGPLPDPHVAAILDRVGRDLADGSIEAWRIESTLSALTALLGGPPSELPTRIGRSGTGLVRKAASGSQQGVDR